MIAVDVTSTFGALRMDWSMADAWFGSVQKCVGLPAGLGFTILSPRAMDKARSRGGARRVAGWQDVLHMAERLAVGQTVETPNVLGIALLVPASAGLMVAEYAPNMVKKSVVGAGHAHKDQIAAMISILLPRCTPDSADAADALAVAITHAHHRRALEVEKLAG